MKQQYSEVNRISINEAKKLLKLYEKFQKDLNDEMKKSSKTKT